MNPVSLRTYQQLFPLLLLQQTPAPQAQAKPTSCVLPEVPLTAKGDKYYVEDPEPAPTNSMPKKGTSFDLNTKLTLPDPSQAEINAADPSIRRFMDGTLEKKACIPEKELYQLIPELRGTGLWVPSKPWKIAGTSNPEHKVFFGAAYFQADLDCIKQAERGYSRYWDMFRGKYLAVYPIKDSYIQGTDPKMGPFVQLDVFYLTKGIFLACPEWEMNFQIREHCQGGRLVVDYYSNSADVYWLAGRDTYYPVCSDEDPKEPNKVPVTKGYLVVTAWGFNIIKCADGSGSIKDSIRDNLGRFMQAGANACMAAKAKAQPKSP